MFAHSVEFNSGIALGTVVVGYRIHDGKWTQIGKMDPQWPQVS